MHLYRWTIFAIVLCLFEESVQKFGGSRGGGFGRSGGGFRGSSGARSSSIFGGKSGGSSFSSRNYGGSFKASGGGQNSFRTRNIGGSSYYIPASGARSRDYFRSSFRSSFMGGMFGFMAGRMIMHSAMTPMRINNYDYYFGRSNYRGSSGQICSVPIQKIDNNEVPFDTTMYQSNNEHIDANEQMDMSRIANEPSPAFDDQVKDSTTNSTTGSTEDFKFSDVTFEDGSKPKEMVWSCPGVYDKCCYLECCPPAQEADNERLIGYALIGIFIIVLLVLWTKNKRSQMGAPTRPNHFST